MTHDDGMTRVMRCYSCYHYTISRCLKDRGGWPDMELHRCPDGIYEPGTSPIEFGGAAEYRLHAKQCQ